MKHLFSTAVAGLALAGLAAGSINAQATPTKGLVATLSHATQLSARDQTLGPLARSKTLHIVISLKLRNQSKLNAFLANPNHQILTPTQFRARFSPTSAQAQTVATFMRRAGFTHITIAANRLLVSGDAPSSVVESAFHTSMTSVQTRDGRLAFANSSAPRIPSSLHGTVLAILGLQNVHELHTFDTPAHGPRLSENQATTYATTGHNPTEFSSIYGAGKALTAAGVSIGIVTEGSLTNVIKDLNTFTSRNKLTTVTTQTVTVSPPASTDTGGDVEWDLDSQDIVGMSGGQVGKLIFYNIPSLSNSNMTADFNTIVTANVVKIINVSLGECETWAGGPTGDGSAAAQDNIFQQADAQGQTFSISSGDSGADECGNGGTTPSWPASSQYVVAVGGTTLSTSGSTWSSETAWSGSGGSPSTFEPMPSWQQGVGQNAGHTTRGVPDIAFDADPNSGSLIIVDGAQQQVGGTSLASPLFVGTWARVIATQSTKVGFAAPLIYLLPSSAFHDVTSGNNKGETAAAGWDYTTGFGSMIIANVVNAISATPFAANSAISTSQNTAVNGTLSASDPKGNPLTFSIVSQPNQGSTTLTNAATGAFTYMPNSNYSGSDSFTFTVKDTVSGLISNTAMVAINTPPVAGSLMFTTHVGQVLKGTLHAVAIPSSDALSYAGTSQPTHGTVTVDATTGAFTYTPKKSYSGSDSFTFTATDAVSGLSSSTATVGIIVQTPPVASNLTLTTDTNHPLSGTLHAVATPSSDALSYVSASQPTHGTITVNATTGAFTYTPKKSYSGSDSFTFTATDTTTGQSSNTATVTITVKVPPASGGGGGGALGLWSLIALLGLVLVAVRWRRQSDA